MADGFLIDGSLWRTYDGQEWRVGISQDWSAYVDLFDNREGFTSVRPEARKYILTTHKYVGQARPSRYAYSAWIAPGNCLGRESTNLLSLFWLFGHTATAFEIIHHQDTVPVKWQGSIGDLNFDFPQWFEDECDYAFQNGISISEPRDWVTSFLDGEQNLPSLYYKDYAIKSVQDDHEGTLAVLAGWYKLL